MGDAGSILDLLFHQQLAEDRCSQYTRDLWLVAQHSPGDPLQIQLCPEDALKLAASQLVLTVRKHRSKDDCKHPTICIKDDVRFHFNIFHEQNVAEMLFYYMVHIFLFSNGHHSFYSC